MDKQTLSNYGWIVIAVLVLAVMIALATPFGTYIENGVRSTTEGLFNTSEKAMNIVGMSAGNGNFENKDDPSTKTYTTLKIMDWDGGAEFSGTNVWTDGTNTYYSNGNTQYVLKGKAWEKKTWNGFTKIYGNSIWTDGTNIYYSNKYVLNGDTWEEKTWNGLEHFLAAMCGLMEKKSTVVHHIKIHPIIIIIILMY